MPIEQAQENERESGLGKVKDIKKYQKGKKRAWQPFACTDTPATCTTSKHTNNRKKKGE
jgi:hypothetical protein